MYLGTDRVKNEVLQKILGGKEHCTYNKE